MSMITHNGKDLHEIYTYIIKKQLEKYTIPESKQHCVTYKNNVPIIKISDSHNMIYDIKNFSQQKYGKMKEEKQKNESKKCGGDYMNSLFEYEMSFQNDEVAPEFVYEK